MDGLFHFTSAVRHDGAIDEWLSGEPNVLFAVARQWFNKFRICGPDVNEVMHDGCPTACVGDAAFGYVNVYKTHINIGFFMGAFLPDPQQLLEGSGKRMRHVKVKPGEDIDPRAVEKLIQDAYRDMKGRL